MLCQNCKINDSTIHLYTNLNGKQKQIDLCQNCYKIIKTDPNNSLFKGMTDLNNRDFDPFGDFFNDLNNFRPSSNTPPIPPTQSGGGYGGNGGYGSQNRGSAQTPPPSQEKGLLEEFGINVTEIARRGDIDPVMGATMRLSVSSRFSIVEPRIILSLSVNLVSEKRPLSKV